MFKSIGIVGCGLIGGSIALCLKKNNPNLAIYGVNRRLEHIRSNNQSSCFKQVVTTINELPKQLDIVFVCTPIETTVANIQAVATHVNNSCIITDVASVKQSIVQQVNALQLKQLFIPGHPMAGKETTGFQSASATLFNQAPYFLVKQQHEVYNEFKLFLQQWSVNIIEIEPSQHDLLVANLSHIPYLSASALTQTAVAMADVSTVKQSYGPGFKDSTRVASSSPQWGEDVCKHNKEAVLKGITDLINTLTDYKQDIENNHITALGAKLEQTKQWRDSLK